VIARLEVDREAFLSAVRLLSRQLGKKLKGQEAVVRFERGTLFVALGDLEVGAAASGDWPGRARIGPHGLKGLALAVNEEGPVVLEVRGDGLYIGTFAVGCAWSPNSRRQIEIPLEPTDRDLIQLAASETDAAIAAAGLTRPVQVAMCELATKVDTIGKLLAPFGVSREAIEAWVLGAIVGDAGTEEALSPAQQRLGLKLADEQLTLGED